MVLLSQVGSFFMINLCLVVIATQFSETKQREHQLMQEQRAQCLSSSTLASEPGDCYEELFQLVCHILRKARRQTVILFNTLRGKPRGFRGVGRGRGGGKRRERKPNGREGRQRTATRRPGMEREEGGAVPQTRQVRSSCSLSFQLPAPTLTSPTTRHP